MERDTREIVLDGLRRWLISLDRNDSEYSALRYAARQERVHHLARLIMMMMVAMMMILMILMTVMIKYHKPFASNILFET